MNWEKNLVALRSLRSEHHATNIEPQIINVDWNLGKRCNYDCSYCSPAIHDWTSPHHSIDSIKDFVDQINNWVRSQNKTFNMGITGGEPFVHPNIIEILKITHDASEFAEQIVITTNGSMPLELYQKSFEYLTHLTISLHLERSDTETQATLDKVILLHQQFPDKWINVQVMCLPGKLEFVENTIMPLLESNNIKFTLRRIRPWLNEAVPEWKDLPKRQILKSVYTLDQQTQTKENEKRTMDKRLAEVYDTENYYSFEELEWFRTHEPATSWQNIALWNEDADYFETNSDIMVSNSKNRFTGWHCFIGVDSLFIDFDGLLYRGVCHNDGPIGRIGSTIDFTTTPTICKKQWCLSNVDMTVRKAHPDYVHLVTQQSLNS